MGFAPTWLRQVNPLLHMTTLTTELQACMPNIQPRDNAQQDSLNHSFHISAVGYSATVI